MHEAAGLSVTGALGRFDTENVLIAVVCRLLQDECVLEKDRAAIALSHGSARSVSQGTRADDIGQHRHPDGDAVPNLIANHRLTAIRHV